LFGGFYASLIEEATIYFVAAWAAEQDQTGKPSSPKIKSSFCLRL
jgi:hypothetical protein